MKILVVNDDGIFAPGIKQLAEVAIKFGEVWVVAPDRQCSAMSHCITILSDLIVRKNNFPVKEVRAYSVSGTPADCVKIALQYILPEKPDYIFSGINNGYNMGLDILYSGTVGAAMEGLIQGIPGIAFSQKAECDYNLSNFYIYEIIKDLLQQEKLLDSIWNVNFPGCNISDCNGILKDRVPAKSQYYLDSYVKKSETEGEIIITARGIPTLQTVYGTDMEAIKNNYISIGKIRNTILNPI